MVPVIIFIVPYIVFKNYECLPQNQAIDNPIEMRFRFIHVDMLSVIIYQTLIDASCSHADESSLEGV